MEQHAKQCRKCGGSIWKKVWEGKVYQVVECQVCKHRTTADRIVQLEQACERAAS